MRIALSTSLDKEVLLSPIKKSDGDEEVVYVLMDEDSKEWMELKLVNNSLEVLRKDELIIEEDENLQSKLDQLILDIIEAEQSGTETTETSPNEGVNPFNPEDIKVHAKQFSLRLIADMIDDGDIDMAPDFQRNLVWDDFQKSRLIESILLRIPLPMFYFSEDKEGRITIVDGLQRLTTIKGFMENKFPLRKLEYLSDSCNERYYKTDDTKQGLDAKYLRWFNQTQFSVNVIDPSSPPKVKYDIFRRINTGGKPLNNQEIRNCLAGKALRNILREMANSSEFKSATDYGIKSKRMEDQEVALRFILFYKLFEKDGNISNYSGYMDTSLDDLTESLYKAGAEDLEIYKIRFIAAMKNAEYLLGNRFAFRKVRTKDILPNAYKKLINKALFASLSVLLADFEPEKIKKNNSEKTLLTPLAEKIESDDELFNYLSYGTNGKNNLLYTFDAIKSLIKENVK